MAFAPFATLHPDDVLFFNEVRASMFRVAKSYSLPLVSVEAMPMPKTSMADRLGDCTRSGNVRLVMRCTVEGEWENEPMSPAEVWDTAAHELAHLRHFNHGVTHAEFTVELREALANQNEDHREKVLRRLVKMQRQRDDAASRAKSGDETAENEAEAFAAAINRMLIEYELNPTDIDYAAASADDPVIELPVDLAKYRIERVRTRVAWQETLARVVANAHLCSFLLAPGSNRIWFVGTRSHATVAEYVYGILVPAASKMSKTAGGRHRNALRVKFGLGPSDGVGHIPEARGYRESWLTAFVERIAERLREAKLDAIREAESREVARPAGAESLAMVRLNGALVKVQRYVDDKFKSKKSTASHISMSRGSNRAGAAEGRAAADKMPIGRRGLDGGSAPKGYLK